MRTVFVERPLEETDWQKHESRYQDAKQWVDIWVPEGGKGFLDIAEALGID